MCETPPTEAAVLAGCAHAFCEDCIGQYVRGKVDEGKVMAEQLVERAPRRCRLPGAPLVVGASPARHLAPCNAQAEQLRCPCVEPKCDAPLLPSDVARCLKLPESVARYERLALQRCVEARTRALQPANVGGGGCNRMCLISQADEGMGCCPTAGCEYMFAFDMDNRK